MKKFNPHIQKVLLINIMVVMAAIVMLLIGRTDLNYWLAFGILIFFDLFFLTSHYILNKKINGKNFNKYIMIYTLIKLMVFVLFVGILVYYFREQNLFTVLLIFLLYFLFTFNEVKYLVAKFKNKE